MSQEFEKYPSTPLARELRQYRILHNLKRTELAANLNVDVKTVGRWEREEIILSDIRELRRIASILGIDAERLGVASSFFLTAEQADEVIQHVWLLVKQSRYFEAKPVVEKLIGDLSVQVRSGDHDMLYRLAKAHQAAGHITAIMYRTSETNIALYHYREMELAARQLQDQTLLNVALTYEGDMYRRKGNLSDAVAYLEAARDEAPEANNAAKGNGIQLLGRAYVQAGNVKGFEQAMAEAEERAAQGTEDEIENTIHGLYSLGTVYEDYNRSYTLLNNTKKAFDYLELAEKTLPDTVHWQTLLKTAQAATLVQSGEITAGIEIAIEAAELCKKHGTLRLLERVYTIQNIVERMTRDINRANMQLRDVLHGPIEYL
uniref:HTH cro/C1-type domain-containing protein n=1 Tax=Thermosporothrix sp. COM3 TaxID=2490863 RepID=A0A455SI19_9CHLR|nr:hypothetical protein KTC_17690 [Thermosporothrix sp. COM3]